MIKRVKVPETGECMMALMAWMNVARWWEKCVASMKAGGHIMAQRCGLMTDGQMNRGCNGRVRNRNEDAAVAQNKQGTEHCGPVALACCCGWSQSSWLGRRDGEGWSAAARPVRSIVLQYYKAMTQHIPLIPYYNTFGKIYDIAI